MSASDPHGNLERLATGVPGLDDLLEGGLPVGGVFLIQGEPGAGKTILGNQLCFHHARSGGQAVYLTLIAESHARMINHLRRFSFYDPELVGQSVHYHAGFRVMQEQGPDGLVALTRNAVVERSATLIVVDGLINAGEVISSPTDFKLLLHAIQTISSTLGCTVILLSSARASDAGLPEHTIVDGIVQLTHELPGMHDRRYLEVRKMRGINAVTGRHGLEIDSGGILVRPRLESRLRTGRSGVEVASSVDRVLFGLPALDAMLHGGLPAGSNTLVGGPTGTGKTMLGLQYLVGGAARGEPGLYCGFYERPESILAKSARMNLGVAAAIEAKLVHLHWERPVEGSLDAMADRLLDMIRRTGSRRLCFDGILALRRMVDSPDRFHAATSALSEELERLGVTTVFTLETPELSGTTALLPLQDVSAVSHNLLMIRHVEQEARMHRLLSIVKMRDSDYDMRIHQLHLTDRGIEVGDPANVEQARPSAAKRLRGPAKPRRKSARRR